ncbi:hypothetical protein BAUCODRAFT_331224 [Baudoinia panamericana UAMH 10762]|uniref:Uncharacterized protein n=1 Tax=Baudoinia panamericana (strain UAMH 10762) TaxID=717646 RepID=M2M307_BAUPA|nr:uncharacterized protein BAUCODRAFT_331224 [Baudoinia panamericana UAMH 10762]EMC90916.1 hypothetical protein BAUCODRAFT_331224 [Baudoinia panamericana UAMH 10762]
MHLVNLSTTCSTRLERHFVIDATPVVACSASTCACQRSSASSIPMERSDRRNDD